MCVGVDCFLRNFLLSTEENNNRKDDDWHRKIKPSLKDLPSFFGLNILLSLFIVVVDFNFVFKSD